ncbi:MAG: porin family protein [Gammaproteobacteria bacterium]
MKMKKVLVTSISVLALAGSALAIAGNRPGAFSVRLGEGYEFFAQKRHIENTSTPNIELGYDFNNRWGIMAGAYLINTDTKDATPNQGVHGFQYFVDGVYRFNTYGNFAPYALGGIGVTSLKPSGSNPTDQINVNLGIGADYFIADSIALGADVRDLYTLSGGKNDVLLTVGIKFLIGGNNPKPIYKDENMKDMPRRHHH